MVGESLPEKEKAASRRRLGPILVVGCACLPVVIFMICAGLFFAPGLIGLGLVTIERERLYNEALAAGDASIAYERADERFRQAYTEEQLVAYFESHPKLFDASWASVSLRFRTVTGENTLFSTTFEAGGTKYIIYATKDGDQLRLLGISPAMDEGVPAEFVEQSK